MHTDEMQKLLKASNWPANVVAKATGIDPDTFAAFLDRAIQLSTPEHERLEAWVVRRRGVSGTGEVFLDPYRPSQTMPPIMAPDARDLPCGPMFDPDAPPPVLKIIDTDHTLARTAKLLDGGQDGVGNAIRAEKVKAGQQVVKENSET